MKVHKILDTTKSYLLKEIYYSYLVNSGISESNILMIELDNDMNFKYRDPLLLGEFVREYCKNKNDCYVFIDEIQLVNSIVNPINANGKHIIARKNDKDTITFVDVVLGLSKEKNIDLYVTGSNSRMLSTDIVTEFRDKATNIQLFPLSFEEFTKYSSLDEFRAINEFMMYGGMPLAVLSNKEEKREYLKGLFNTTYFRDIIEHNHLKKSEALDTLANIISSCTGELINAEKISNTYKSIAHDEIDKETVTKYLNYFEDSFIIQEVKRYDVKGRMEIGALRKYYFIDTGLRNARLDFIFPDEGQMLENIVFNELKYNGYSINVGTFERVEKNKDGKSIKKNFEIDFIAEKGNKKYYIQVSSDISNAETKAREIKPYIALNDQIQKIVVINRPIDECKDDNGFTIIGITDFLLRFIK